MSNVNDGLGTTIELEQSGLVLTRLRITAPAVEGGDAIDLTHLGNTTWETSQPRQLKGMDNVSFEAVYDPSLLVSAPINTNQRILIKYPDASRHRIWGFLKRLEPGEMVEGGRCLCTGTLVVTNTNNATAKAEAAPVYYATSVTLTGTATT